ncbi:MAG: 50S ribosomal protein L4P, large subunit ribosomal protein L4e [archaeon GW2011_AR3]|nr:50S ribosomal protein L4P, large subunit ribosomal protein L4e [uncultured archaeon]KHO46799.1 MAG: 50S ribosomal protein L4P, large subunit ribosomal protein L4e [archaeon GW2011_AR3]MBS3109336.1 50S ribosomal protein L4 [Candidatus Woesearchaeota archaeon]
MKIPVVNAMKNEVSKKELPRQFAEEFRPDIIKRVVIAIQGKKRQRYGAFPMAGKQSSAVVSRRRRDYRGSYGLGISRVPRKIMSSRGTRMNWVGAFAPGMVGGRRAHPPKAEKSFDLKVNKKERRKAIRSALAATMDKNIVMQRGHLVPENFPFIIESQIENMEKTNEIFRALKAWGLENEYARNSEKKVRAGRGKSRGRRYKMNRGMLLVVSKDCGLYRRCSNLPGVEIEIVSNLNAEMLAPGTYPGRLTLFTEAAIDRLANENLFTDEFRAAAEGQSAPAKPGEKTEARKAEKADMPAKAKRLVAKTGTKKSASRKAGE